MAEVKEERKISYALNLTEKEAIWLKRYLQNPFLLKGETEPVHNYNNRSSIWLALDNGGVESQ